MWVLGICLACLPPACLLACRLPATSCPCRLLVPVVSRLLAGSVLWPAGLQPGFGWPVSADCTKDNSAPEAARLYSCLLSEIKSLLWFCRQYCLKNTLLSIHILYEWFEEKKFLEVLWHHFFFFSFLIK